MYGIVNLINGGPFAFFPINEIVFFLVVSYFSFLNFKNEKAAYLLFLLIAILGILKNQLFLGIFMSNLGISEFLNHALVKYIPFFISTLILFEISRFFLLTKSKLYFFPIIIPIYCIGAYFDVHSFQTFAVLLFFIVLTLYFKKEYHYHEKYSKSLYFLWALYLFLKASTLFSMYLYGFEMEF